MEVGTDVWLREKSGDQAWIPATIHSKTQLDDGSYTLIVKSNITGDDSSFKIADGSDDLDDVKLRNTFEAADTKDLINLPYLHEPAILCCLEQRYMNSDIYTYTGPILIAVNPFKKVNLYSAQILEMYYNVGLLKSQGIEGSQKLPPHVYAVADAAFRNMMIGIHGAGSNSSSNCNQSILISGESGAGKTESTKIVLKYLTTVGSSSGGIELDEGSVMDKILQSNPILEAFGNARTLRNDNSSRFGKYIELNFNRRGHLIGGMIRTYLLEKVRIPTQQSGERNFHIFYQMAKGGSTDELMDWEIDSLADFYYVNQGGIFELDHVDDKMEFIAMKNALSTLNFDSNSQVELFNVLAGLLHMGELQFVVDKDGEGSDLAGTEKNMKHLNAVVRLCGLNVDFVNKTLTERTFTARGETFTKKLTKIQAYDAKDALTKAIYGKIFDFIVIKINQSIQVDKSKVRSDIGVLDIFGFECFKMNSFEQLCINYTNETLQQQFNQFVFKMEQLEYQRENIDWNFIEFPDNQDCLDLIEHKINGIFAMIDDECKLPKASDERLAGRMNKAYENNKRYSVTITQKRDFKFCVHHYAGPVVYNVVTFVDKNKDELPKEAYSLFQSSSTSLLSSLFNIPSSEKGAVSVGSQFKDQLSKLMEKIYSTAPHYIRCLKPNDLNAPDHFHRTRITEQLRYGGVLEAVRVARSGFPVRLSHQEFYSRYRPLMNPHHRMIKSLPRVLPSTKTDARKLCTDLLQIYMQDDFKIDIADDMDILKARKLRDLAEWSGKLDVSNESIQLGATKVFLRKNAHDILESKRSKRLVCAATLIQSKLRTFVAVKMFHYYQCAVQTLQRAVRVYFACKRVDGLRRLNASIVIQRNVRSFVCRMKFLFMKHAARMIQSKFRSYKSCQLAKAQRYTVHSLRLQRICRGLITRYRFNRYLRAVVTLQCKLRCKIARRALRDLRMAARDIGKLKQSNESLKQEIEMLKAKASEDARKIVEQMRVESDAKALQQKDQEIANLALTVEELRSTLKKEKNLRQEKETELDISNKRVIALETQLRSNEQHISSQQQQVASSQQRILDLENQISTFRTHATSSPNIQSSFSPVTPAASKDNTKYVPMTPVKEGQRPRTDSTHDTSKQMHSATQDLTRAMEQLSLERAGKSILEEEISRLRTIILDLSSQNEALKKQVEPAPARRQSMTMRRPSNEFTSPPPPSQAAANRRMSLQAGDSPFASDIHEKPNYEDVRARVNNSNPSSGNRRKSVTGGLSPSVSNSNLLNSPTVDSHASALEQFEKNIDMLRKKLQVGIQCQLWEGQRVSKLDVTLNLDTLTQTLQFNYNGVGRRFQIFRVDVSPISLSQIVECYPGAEIASEQSEDYRLLTIVASSEGSSPRVVALKVASKDDRNVLLTSLRALASSAMTTTSPELTRSNTEPVFESNPLLTNQTGAGQSVRTQRKATMRDTVLKEAISNTSNSSAPIGSRNNALANKKIVRSNTSTPSVPVDLQAPPPASATSSQGFPNVEVEHLKTQLNAEQSNQQKQKYQIITLTNELLERDEQISHLKKRDNEFLQQIQQKDKMYEQDAMVRMQLGKRLEQVLMDKEEAMEQLELLTDQNAALRELISKLSK